MPMTPEGKVKEAVKKFLRLHGIWYFMPVAGPFTVHGVPDFICCWNGKFMGIETKAPKKLNTLTENQKRVISEIERSGGLVYVVDDVRQLEQLMGVIA